MMLRMLDRHVVQALLDGKVAARAIAAQFQISVRTVRRIAREAGVGRAEHTPPTTRVG